MTKPHRKPPEDQNIRDLFNVFGADGDEGGKDILHYTPAKGEPIEITAMVVYEEMMKRKMDVEIHFKDFILQVGIDDAGLSEDYIVEAYYGALDEVKEILAARRKNNKAPKKPKGPKG